MNKTWIIDELCSKAETVSRISVTKTGSGNALFSETGARILGLFPSPDHPNTLFVPDDIHPRLANKDWLLGGERQWIAPQQDYFFTNPDKFGGFHVQSGFDPGMYIETDTLHFENSFTLTNHRTNKKYSDCISRRKFTPIVNDPLSSGLLFAGVSINDYLSMPAYAAPFCAWSIAMVSTQGEKQPGTTYIPYTDNRALVNYFNPVPEHRCKKNNSFAQFLIDSKDPYKLAITPDGVNWRNPVKIIYVSPFDKSDQWFCVVKCSSDLPKTHDDCVDIPSYDKSSPKGAIQAYNHGYGSEMLYGEIELQFPKGKQIENQSESSGNHELLSYCGTKELILDFVREMLLINHTPEVY